MSKITTLDEFEAAYKARLGEPLPPRPWRTVTEEWLSCYADGAGDYNPLFRDRSYADAGRYHSLVAAPGFVFSIDFGANASIWGHIPEADVSMRDLTILYLGAAIEWYRPIWLGERIRAIEIPSGIRRTTLRQANPPASQGGPDLYRNHRILERARRIGRQAQQRHVALPQPRHRCGVIPVERGAGGIAPDPLVWERTRRGDRPRYWDTVAEGEVIPELPKGTFTTTELYLFAHGALSTRRTRKVDEGTIDMGPKTGPLPNTRVR